MVLNKNYKNIKKRCYTKHCLHVRLHRGLFQDKLKFSRISRYIMKWCKMLSLKTFGWDRTWKRLIMPFLRIALYFVQLQKLSFILNKACMKANEASVKHIKNLYTKSFLLFLFNTNKQSMKYIEIIIKFNRKCLNPKKESQ